jgi:hypothetical protein
MEQPESPVTEDEVLGWFPASKVFGKPQKGDVTAKLTWEIERRRQMVQVGKGPKVEASARQLALVVKQAKSLEYEIAHLRLVAGWNASGSEIKNLFLALKGFLRAAPGNAPGGQPKEQIVVAAKMAPLVAKCLERPNKAKPSLVSQAGPVVTVLTKAIRRIFGTAISAASLSDGLKAHRKRQTASRG